MPREGDGGSAPAVTGGKRFSEILKPAEKQKRPSKYLPMRRMSLAWEPDFASVRAALNLPPEAKDVGDRSGDGRS
jgi:hypothetical protein